MQPDMHYNSIVTHYARQNLKDVILTALEKAEMAWFSNVSKKIHQSGLTPLGIHVLLGDCFKVMAHNQRNNLEEGRIVLAQIVARK